MAAKLGTIKSRNVTRETLALCRSRAIMVQLSAGGRLVRFREKGRRQWHTATVEQLFWVAVGNTAAEAKKRKIEDRKARKLARKEGRQ